MADDHKPRKVKRARHGARIVGSALAASYATHVGWSVFERLIEIAHVIPSPRVIASVVAVPGLAVPALVAVTVGCFLIERFLDR